MPRYRMPIPLNGAGPEIRELIDALFESHCGEGAKAACGCSGAAISGPRAGDRYDKSSDSFSPLPLTQECPDGIPARSRDSFTPPARLRFREARGCRSNPRGRSRNGKPREGQASQSAVGGAVSITTMNGADDGTRRRPIPGEVGRVPGWVIRMVSGRRVGGGQPVRGGFRGELARRTRIPQHGEQVWESEGLSLPAVGGWRNAWDGSHP
jgi:hypothetical protein